MREFLDRLAKFRVLDPACGSGNFLYLALHALKDLEHRIRVEAQTLGLQPPFPAVGPANVKGIELNPYAAELARVSVWIVRDPMDAASRVPRGSRSDPETAGHDRVPGRGVDRGRARAGVAGGGCCDWESAVSGYGKLLSHALSGENYVSRMLRKTYAEPRASWRLTWCATGLREGRPADRLGKARRPRAGLVATNSISGGATRTGERSAAATDGRRIFEAWSDEPWVDRRTALRCECRWSASRGHE